MNTTYTSEATAVIHTEAWAEVAAYAKSIHHLSLFVTEQETLSDAAIALGHGMRLLADQIHDNASTYLERNMTSADLQDAVWTDVMSRAGNIQRLADLLRDKSVGNLDGFALAAAIEALAGHIEVIAGENAP